MIAESTSEVANGQKGREKSEQKVYAYLREHTNYGDDASQANMACDFICLGVDILTAWLTGNHPLQSN